MYYKLTGIAALSLCKQRGQTKFSTLSMESLRMHPVSFIVPAKHTATRQSSAVQCTIVPPSPQAEQY